MPLSKKRATKVKDPEMQKAIDRIYDDMNSLITAINQGVGDGESLASGKSGDIRVVDNSDRNVSIEVRSEKGWFASQIFKSDPNVTGITDSTEGTAATTIENTTGVDIAASTGTQVPTVAEFENAIASLSSKLNEIIVIVNDMNPKGFSMVQSRKGN